MKKICIVGLGNMGKAIFELLNDGVSSLNGDVSAKKLFEVTGFERDGEPNSYLELADILILAVKPQDFRRFAESVEVDLSRKLAISIMAGVSLGRLMESLQMDKVVRTLPNLALKIGQSFTLWKASEAVVDEERELVKNILRIFGEEVEVANETQIEEIGAISACGPAYFAFLAEMMERSARRHGMSEVEAAKMTKKTFIGSAMAMEKSDWSPSEFRAKVTSKGGTTQAAISYMQEQKFEEIFLEAIEKAIKRTRELNN